MLKDIGVMQRALCEKCEYRDKTHDNVVFCPYSRDCIKLKKLENDKKSAETEVKKG